MLRRQGPLPIAVAVDYLLQACDAIAEAHLDGVVHRDIKPSNLFLAKTAEGESIKVLDFGIAKARRTDLKSLTGTGVALGSPYYMPPEQLVDSREVHGTADIWALGVTLFELVSGQPCFHGEDVGELFTAVLRDEPIPLADVRPDAPAALGQVLARCLQKLPEDRYASVAELATELEPFGTERGRLLAHRIRGLTFRRSARPGTDAPTGVLPSATAPTLVGPSPGYHPPGPTLPSAPGFPSHPGQTPSSGSYAAPSHRSSSTTDHGLGPSPPDRRRGLAIAATSAAVVMLAVAVTAFVVAWGGPETSSSAPDRKGPSECIANTCTLVLADLDLMAPEVTIDRIAALLAERVAGMEPTTYMLHEVGVDGTVGPSSRLYLTFMKTTELVTVVVGDERSQITTTPTARIPMPVGHLSHGCPIREMLAEVRRRHPQSERVTATLSLADGPKWNVHETKAGGGMAWHLTLAEDCAPL